MASENFTVTWAEDPKSVGKRKAGGQYTAVSRQVTGSSNYVTWYTFEPNQSVTTNWQEEFFAYQSSTEIDSGVTITGFNSASVDLGNWYQFSDNTNSWTQMSAPPMGQVQAPSDSIGLYYNVPSGVDKSTTFGLQCKVEGSQEATAICADTIFSNQPVLYTPLTTLYASMGKTYKTNTVIASIGNWDTLRFAGTTANVSFNDGQSRWLLTSPAAYMMASESYSVTWAEDSKSVGKRKQAGQYTAVSRQVTGSSNYVTWYTFEPNQSVTTNWQEEFFCLSVEHGN